MKRTEIAEASAADILLETSLLVTKMSDVHFVRPGSRAARAASQQIQLKFFFSIVA